MIIHDGYKDIKLISPVVTLGIFDGVHRGHQDLLGHLVSRAKEINGESVVITFDPHPRLVLDKNRNELSFLTTMDEKKTLLGNAGIDHVIIIRFTPEFSRMNACDFVKEVLVQKIGTSYLVVGYDHHFGKDGGGNFDTIKECAASFGFSVGQVQGFKTEEGAISSSIIRDALLKGKLDDANRLLGYNYSLRGSIVKGRRIGRMLGFPTANIKPDYQYKLIPGDGVYAVGVQIDRFWLKGMLSIGKNPTVSSASGSRSIEVNIFDFEKDIYGKEIKVVFRSRLRDEIKFDSIEQLARQMELDREHATRLLT